MLFGMMLAIVPAQRFLEAVTQQPVGHAHQSRYAAMRNSDLKKEAAVMAEVMRKYAARARLEQLKAVTGHANSTGENPFRHLFRYDREVKPRALGLRNEILTRLPQTQRPHLKYSSLEFAISASMLDEGAETLEMLADQLPAMRFRERKETLPPPPLAPTPPMIHL